MLHPEAANILAWFTKHHPNFDLLCNCLKPDNVIDAVKKYPPKRIIELLYGKYRWSFDESITYKQYMRKHRAL